MTEPGGLFIATASVDPASLATDLSGDTAVTVVGVQTSMKVLAIPPSDLEAGLVLQSAWVSAQNTISVRIANLSAGTVNGAARTWTFIIVTGDMSLPGMG